jgi:hypothetical protein
VQGEGPVVLCQVLGAAGFSAFVAPDGVAFKSAAGRTCIPAFFKFNQGWLFPLPRALAFVGARLACLRALVTKLRPVISKAISEMHLLSGSGRLRWLRCKSSYFRARFWRLDLQPQLHTTACRVATRWPAARRLAQVLGAPVQPDFGRRV